jgi:beta-glucanase (GH16 family)
MKNALLYFLLASSLTATAFYAVQTDFFQQQEEDDVQLLLESATNVVDFPIDFECEFTTYAFNEFGGAPTVVIDNPDASGINMSSKVAELTKVQDAADFAGVILTLEDPIDFGISSVFKMKVWSPKAGIIVKFKLENLIDGGIANEQDAMTTVTNEWEELTFDFSDTDAAGKSLQKVIVFFDFGAVGDGAIYYFDDIVQEGNDMMIACENPDDGGGSDMATNVVDFPIDFECEFTTYAFNEFGGAPTVVIDNPDASGINTSSKVAELTKVQDAADFAGVIVTLVDPIDFGVSSVFKMKVWSPKAGIIVKFKLENLIDGGIANEKDAMTTVTNTWEELTFDFSDTDAAGKSLQKVIVFLDFGNFGDGSVYYFDDIVQEGNTATIACEEEVDEPMATNVVDFPIDFECEFTDYAFIEFGGAPTAIIDNPDASGINTSTKVAELTKTAGAADFAGAFLTLEDPIDFSVSSVFKMKVWSPKAGIIVKFKLENLSDGGIANEKDATTTVTNEWEELTFDFSDTDAASKSLQKVVVFFDFGNFGDGSVYYFDDIVQEGNDAVIACEGIAANTIVFPVDFECEFIDYAFIEFGGAPTVVIDNPDPSGINTSSKVAEMTKTAGAADFAGAIVTLEEPIDFSISSVFKMKVWSPKAGIIVKFKLENLTDGGIANEKDATTTVTNTWEELTFDFSDTDANTKSLQKIVVFFDFGNFGDGSIYYFDDIAQEGNTGMTNCQIVGDPNTPSVAAVCPPECETAVAIFSDRYDQLEGTNFFPDWAQTTEASIVTIEEGEEALKYANFNYQGIELANPIDVSGLTNLHVDVWSKDLDRVNIFPISQSTGERSFELVLELGVWNSFDIPLSFFTDQGLSFTDIFQFKFDGGTGVETIFVDNLYFNGACYIPPACPELVWADEFNGTELNLEDWTFEIGDGCPELCGWGNNELQYYREENTTVADGILTITAKQESFAGYDYTSSRIVTKDKQDFTYGRMEASIKVPEGQGIWPAFWMFHSDGKYGVWPLSGEIDIMEYLGQETDRIFGTIHHGDLFPNNRNTSGDFRLVEGGFNERFYEYAIEWEENVIRWYVDDYLYLTLRPEDIAPDFWAFNQDFHFLLNVAVGGTLPGPPDASTTFPQAMEVDYVRVYKGRFPHLTGAQRVDFQTKGSVYTVNNAAAGTSFEWSVPEGATIVSGQGTNEIVVDWGGPESSGTLSVTHTGGCTENTINLVVEVDVERVAVLETVLENFDLEPLITPISQDGTLEEDVDNPDPNDVNDSVLSGKYTRNPNVQFDVLQYSTEEIDDAGKFTSGSKTFFIDVYTDAPVGTPILLQLENSTESQPANFPVGRHSRYQAVTTVQNAWETLELTFVDRPDGGTSDTGVDRIIFLFNSNTFTENMYFFDNFEIFCTDERENCFDDMDITLADPCNCSNPNNVMLPEGTMLFQDTLLVDASSFTNPVVTLASQDGNLLDVNGNPIDPATATFLDLGNSQFGLVFYTRLISHATVVVDVNGQQRTFVTASCRACPEDVPALSQWGLLIFGLFMANLSLVFMYRRSIQLVEV